MQKEFNDALYNSAAVKIAVFMDTLTPAEAKELYKRIPLGLYDRVTGFLSYRARGHKIAVGGLEPKQ